MKTKQVDQPTWLFSDFDYGLVTLLCHENTKKIQENFQKIENRIS